MNESERAASIEGAMIALDRLYRAFAALNSGETEAIIIRHNAWALLAQLSVYHANNASDLQPKWEG